MAERTETLERLRHEVAAVLAGGVRTPELLTRVGRAFVALLPVDGAAVSIMTDTAQRETLYASDEVMEHVEDLQFSLGEGPCVQAFESGRPVLAPDLAAHRAESWPTFAAGLSEWPVGAIFAFPIVLGAIRVGALDLYRTHPGSLSSQELSTALQVVDFAAMALLCLRDADNTQGGDSDWLTTVDGHDHREVHQATGVLSVQLGVPVAQAFVRLRGHAFTQGRLVHEIAAEIVGGQLSLDEA